MTSSAAIANISLGANDADVPKPWYAGAGRPSGLKCDDYNALADFYTVRQSHAHAWVEVLGSDNYWHTFDPTSGREAPTEAKKIGL